MIDSYNQDVAGLEERSTSEPSFQSATKRRPLHLSNVGVLGSDTLAIKLLVVDGEVLLLV